MTPATGSGRTKHLRWLRDALSELEREGVLDPPAVERVRAFYRLDALGEPRNLSLLIFGVMGAALFGAGVILIVAHNWEELTRTIRACIAVGMLLSAQALAAWVLAARPRSPAWTESSALILTLFVGAAIALISQTYHIDGELGDFLITWVVLVIPVFYLLRARVAAALCFALAVGIPTAPSLTPHRDLVYAVVTFVSLPYLLWVRAHQPGQARTALLGWAAALAVPFGLFVVVVDHSLGSAEDVGVVLFAALFAAMLAWGSRDEPEAPSPAGPVSTVGLCGVAGIALAMTFEDAWPWTEFADFQSDLRVPGVGVSLFVSAALAGYLLSQMSREARQRNWQMAVAMALPMVSILGSVLANADIAIVLGNLFAFALGLTFVWSGLEALRLRRTNVGLSILSLLFGLRFVDSEWSLLARGVGMMIVGLAFVAVNVWLVRRQGASVRREPGAQP